MPRLNARSCVRPLPLASLIGGASSPDATLWRCFHTLIYIFREVQVRRCRLVLGPIVWLVAAAAPRSGHTQTARIEIEHQYESLAAAIRSNDPAKILALQSPSFTSVNVTGEVFRYAAMADYTRRLTSLIDSVIHIRNAIRTFRATKDTAVAEVCQEFSRLQRFGSGPAHRVDTSVLQTETWLRTVEGWRRDRVSWMAAASAGPCSRSASH